MSGFHVAPCQRTGCSFPASRYPQVLIPALGTKRGDREPIAMFLPLAICVAHQPSFDPQDFLGELSRERLRQDLSRAGKAPADFDAAWVEWRRIGDDEYRLITSAAKTA